MARYRKAVVPLALSVCLTAAGCGTEGLASLPLPAPGVGSGGYT
ncbi:MAG TPA: mammalian cell entry protein, partial [Mycobacterium sp.]|nr:mammalian cell entry protein [Mycobacterium sp.]